MSKCKHPKARITERTVGYQAIEALNPDPIATGNVTIIETCQQCGVERLTNSNAGHTETTGWGSHEDTD